MRRAHASDEVLQNACVVSRGALSVYGSKP